MSWRAEVMAQAAATSGTPVLDLVLAPVVAAATGFASALVPVINAELALIAAARVWSTPVAVAVAVGLAVGQTVGKVLVFLAARRGASWHRDRRSRRSNRGRRGDGGGRPRHRALGDRIRPWVDGSRGRLGRGGVVLLSASVGVPPLAVVSAAVGAMARHGASADVPRRAKPAQGTSGTTPVTPTKSGGNHTATPTMPATPATTATATSMITNAPPTTSAAEVARSPIRRRLATASALADFTACCFVGRTARFLAVLLGAQAVVT
ncbi:MAG: hypothetical protein ACRC35_11365 [Angustibacter sp.]